MSEKLRGRPVVHTFYNLEVGAYEVIPFGKAPTMSASANAHSKKTGKKFSVKTVEGEKRIYRTA